MHDAVSTGNRGFRKQHVAVCSNGLQNGICILSHYKPLLPLSAASARIRIAAERIRSDIGRNRTRTQSVNQVVRLADLRKLCLCLCQFSPQRVDLLIREEVKDRSAVRIRVVDDIESAVLDRVPSVAGLRCQIVVRVGKSALDQPLGFAAARLILSSHVAKLVLDAEAGLHDVCVDTVHLGKLVIAKRAKSVLDIADPGQNALRVEAALKISLRDSARCIRSSAVIAAPSAIPAACEQEQAESQSVLVAHATARITQSPTRFDSGFGLYCANGICITPFCKKGIKKEDALTPNASV